MFPENTVPVKASSVLFLKTLFFQMQLPLPVMMPDVPLVRVSKTQFSMVELLRQSIPMSMPLNRQFHASLFPHPLLSLKAEIVVLELPFWKSIEWHDVLDPPTVSKKKPLPPVDCRTGRLASLL